MPSPNASIAKRFFDAPRTGEDITPFIHPEIEIHDYDLPDAGVLSGLEGFERYLKLWDDVWEEWEWTLEELLEAGDQVALLFTIVARGRDGARTERRNGIVLTFREGFLSRMEYYAAQADGRAALGRPSTSG